MSNPSTRATYSLDAHTIRKLEDMARRWGVSKSEALRRAVKSATVNGHGKEDNALKALDRLQDSLRLTPAKARAWDRRVRAERRTSSSRQERRRR
ncbi:MAG: ribbon-helix-helix protein, CopG family [Deltaproteobacteria bacterium]|nr:ribbon-helix-helix protein, CopG family [Deltaproteobacteria bacterium]